MADFSSQRQEGNQNEVGHFGGRGSLRTTMNFPNGNSKGTYCACANKLNNAETQLFSASSKSKTNSHPAAASDGKAGVREANNGEAVLRGSFKEDKSCAAIQEQENVIKIVAADSVKKREVWLSLVAADG